MGNAGHYIDLPILWNRINLEHVSQEHEDSPGLVVPGWNTMDVTNEIEYTITAALSDIDLELVQLRVGGASRQPRLTVFVDRVGGVTIGECVEATKELRRLLAEYYGPDRQFSLNVSSPGADRPLKSRKDFRLIKGRRVIVSYQIGEEPVEKREIEGDVVVAEETELILGMAGQETPLAIPYHRILSARIRLPY